MMLGCKWKREPKGEGVYYFQGIHKGTETSTVVAVHSEYDETGELRWDEPRVTSLGMAGMDEVSDFVGLWYGPLTWPAEGVPDESEAAE